ncbi:MAG: hypothetical protein MUP11_12775 [Anaerolineales bacterium]|nr:hypothetical protein [Anaerolineales bacterium]
MLSRFFVPDTWDYMIAGYLVLTVVISAYMINIAIRWKKAIKEYASYAEQEE